MTTFSQSAKPDEWFLMSIFFSRRLAYPVARLCVRLGISANTVTLLGGMCWVVSVPLLLLAGLCFSANEPGSGWPLLLGSALLWNLGYFLDVVDGSVARMTNSACASGYYLDFVFHLVFSPVFLCSIGVFLYLAGGSFVYLLVGVMSIWGNWGLSIAAKQHVLCEETAKGALEKAKIDTDDRYSIFIDSARARTRHRYSFLNPAFLRRVVEEIISFPGQYVLLSLLCVADLLLRQSAGDRFLFLRTGFLVISTVMILRVPFRIRREFKTLTRYDRLKSGSKEEDVCPHP